MALNQHNRNDAISFVIPTFNEEKYIGGVIDSIKKCINQKLEYEIIVVDNGSNDASKKIAKEKGAKIICRPTFTIAALRNLGVSMSHHDTIVFLDADVFLSKQWGNKIREVITSLKDNQYIITGSVCGISRNPGCIEKCWWGKSVLNKNANYMNSGHMIIKKTVFEALGKFDAKLTTGEDSEFCQRKRNADVSIINNPDLKVFHEGYPKTVGEFYQRERWHGLGDYISISHICRSKPAILSIFQFLLLISCISAAIIFLDPYLLLIYLTTIILLCGAAAFHRCKKISRCLPVCMFLYAIYFMARTHSLFDLLKKQFL